MIVNPMIGSSARGSQEYVQNGLVIYEDNLYYRTYNAREMVTMDAAVPMTFSALSVEIFARIDGFAGSTYLTLFGARPFVFGGCDSSASKGDEADFGIDVWWGNDNHFLPVDGLVFGEWHTFTLVSDTAGVRVYIDGDLKGTIGVYSYNLNISTFGMLRSASGITNSYVANGYWASARMYNRALSAAEIAHNRAVDLQKYNV